eukprot:c8368_g1_i1.p1 GENE.c8368_g1_i1~~c8368_g1_i1.p1  ORF type:complete len:273 (+),score=40.02 c8368_g1_i1:53-820(+)
MTRLLVLFACLVGVPGVLSDPGDGCCSFPGSYPGIYMDAYTYFLPDASPNPMAVTGAIKFQGGLQANNVVSKSFNGSASVTYLSSVTLNSTFVYFQTISPIGNITSTTCFPLGPPEPNDNSVCYGISATGRSDDGDRPVYNGTTVIGGKTYELYSSNMTVTGTYDATVTVLDVSNCVPVALVTIPTPYMQTLTSPRDDPAILYANIRFDGVFPPGFFDLPAECSRARLAPASVRPVINMRRIHGFVPFVSFGSRV